MKGWEEVSRAVDRDPLTDRLRHVRIPGDPPDLPSVAVCRSLVEQSRRARVRQRVITLIAVLVCLGLLALNPTARAAAASILPAGLRQEFGLVVGAPTRLPAGSGREVRPDLSLAQAQARVSFTIPTPTPPAGFTFVGALVGSRTAVYLKYTSGSETIGLWVRKGQQSGGSAVPQNSVIPVTVGGAAGYLVRGSYQDNGPGTASTWNPNFDAQEIVWSQGGLSFDLTTEGMGLSNQGAVDLASAIVPH